jgi:hypothetical protein
MHGETVLRPREPKKGGGRGREIGNVEYSKKS